MIIVGQTALVLAVLRELVLRPGSCLSKDKSPESRTSPAFHPVDGGVASDTREAKDLRSESNPVLFLPIATCMTVGKALDLSEPQFLHRI